MALKEAARPRAASAHSPRSRPVRSRCRSMALARKRPNRPRQAADPFARLYWPSPQAPVSTWPAPSPPTPSRNCAQRLDGLRARARLRPGRRRRHRPRRGRSQPRALARRASATAAWTTCRATAGAAAGRRSSFPARLRVISVRMAASAPDARTARATCLPTGARATSRATRSAATITRCCAAASPSSHARLEAEIGPFGYRAFVDSAPVMEKPLARNAGLGWIGKHTNLINERAGSLFMLGELFTDLPLRGRRARARTAAEAAAPACPPARRGDHCALSARRTPLHLLPDDRAPRPDSRGAPSGDRQPDLRLRRLPARLPLEQVRAGRRRARLPRAPPSRRARTSSSCSPGPRRSTSRRPRAARFAVSAFGAGCGTSRSRSATRRHRRARWRRCSPRAATTRIPSCASTSRWALARQER